MERLIVWPAPLGRKEPSFAHPETLVIVGATMHLGYSSRLASIQASWNRFRFDKTPEYLVCLVACPGLFISSLRMNSVTVRRLAKSNDSFLRYISFVGAAQIAMLAGLCAVGTA